MGDFVKELNIIDFLGILLPGTVVLLLINYTKTQTLTGLEFTATDVVLLIVGGYVLGSLLHEVWDLLEKILWMLFFLDPKIYAARAVDKEIVIEQKSKKKTNEINKTIDFKKDVVSWFEKSIIVADACTDENGLPEIESKCKQVCSEYWKWCRKIREWLKNRELHQYSWIRRYNPLIQTLMVNKGNFTKRTVFDGFHVMMRNLFCAILLIRAGAKCLKIEDPMLAFLSEYIGDYAAYVRFVLLLLMLIRSYHYAYLKYKYTYENFVVWYKGHAQKENDGKIMDCTSLNDT